MNLHINWSAASMLDSRHPGSLYAQRKSPAQNSKATQKAVSH